MKRKISANIELKTVEFNANNEDDSPQHQEFKFLPCEIISCYYEYPLKIMSPQSTSDANCQWIYPVIFGGGLVEGDNIDISVKIGNYCCALLTTLSFPKVYCCENGFDSQQHVKYDVCSHALLCVLPDPLICYKNASYIQTQTYYLSSNANVVSLDWFTSGRYERGEAWAFSKLKSVSTFYVDKKLVFRESQNIQNSCSLNIKDSMKHFNCFGTCVIFGSYLSFLYEKLLSQLGRRHAYGEKFQTSSLFAVSPLYLSETVQPVGCIIRFATESIPQAMQKMEDLLEPLFEFFGANPFQHK